MVADVRGASALVRLAEELALPVAGLILAAVLADFTVLRHSAARADHQ